MGDSGMTEEPKKEYRGPQGNEQKGISSFLVGAAIALAVLLIIGLWMYVGPSTTTQKKDFVQAVGVLLAGLVGLIGLLLTWRNQRLTQRSLEDAQRNTQEQIRLTEQGQITERFTRAIDQLGATDDDGNPRVEIRLGGIYALERIDKESPNRAYHGTVMEVLTAYVRENAPLPPKSSKPPERNSESGFRLFSGFGGFSGRRQPASSGPRVPTADNQAILDVLRRAQAGLPNLPKKYRARLDLHKANLQGADLQGIDLQGANLQQANFYRAGLEKANLQKANLQQAKLPEARLGEADLRATDLRATDLRAADLRAADLRAADLRAANFQLANLCGAEVTDEQLADALSLQGATMPDGQTYDEEWLKDKEGSGKDVEDV